MVSSQASGARSCPFDRLRLSGTGLPLKFPRRSCGQVRGPIVQRCREILNVTMVQGSKPACPPAMALTVYMWRSKVHLLAPIRAFKAAGSNSRTGPTSSLWGGDRRRRRISPSPQSRGLGDHIAWRYQVRDDHDRHISHHLRSGSASAHSLAARRSARPSLSSCAPYGLLTNAR